MSASLNKEWEALASDATKLGDAKFLKIFNLLEQLGDKPGIQSAFEKMRPRLAELKPPRRPSVSRLFFRPVEDLLDNADAYQRKLSRIARSTLAPAWAAVSARLGPEIIEATRAAIHRCDAHDQRGIAEAAGPIWRAGAEAMAEVIHEARNNLKYKVDNFGRDDDVIRQLDTIRQILEIGPELEALKLRLPERPIGELAEGHLDEIRKALGEIGQEEARRAGPLMLALSARMRRPGDLLRVLQETRLGGSVSDKEEMSRELSGHIVGNLLRQTTEIERTSSGKADAVTDLAATAERLADGLNSVNETVNSLRDKAMTEKVASARAEIGDFVVRNIVEGVDRNLLEALFSGGDGAASDERMRQAEQLALALRRSSKLAPFLGIQREVGGKITELRQQIEGQTNQLVDAAAPEAQRQMFNSLRMIEILAGSDEAERLYRSWKLRMS
ncbi:MAG TPA: hypothetical protein VED40_08290 [Azospirillaceae bacterium]|nr:hypothetical protein [Azospirillaceae bacterium]